MNKGRSFLLVLLAVCAGGMLYAQTRPAKRLIPFNGGALAFEVSGKGAPLLLLHGGFQDGSMWAPQMKAYTRHFRVINIDLPGHGRSTPGRGRPDADSILLAVMDSLHLAKASIVSLSFGSAIALEFTSRHPERVEKLVMASPALQGWDEVQKPDTSTVQAFTDLFAALERKDTAAAARQFVQTWYAGPTRPATMLPEALNRYGYTTTLRNMRQHHVVGWPDFSKPYTYTRVDSIEVPVFLLLGRKDMIEVPRVANWLQRHLAKARLQSIEGAHMINLEQPARFNEITLGFLLEGRRAELY